MRNEITDTGYIEIYCGWFGVFFAELVNQKKMTAVTKAKAKEVRFAFFFSLSRS